MKTISHNIVQTFEDNHYSKRENKIDNSSTINRKWWLLCCGGLCLTTILVIVIVVPFLFLFLTSEYSTKNSTDIPCATTCTLEQICVNSACVGVGYLSFTLTWSRNGDGDLVVTTPNNKRIYYNNKGPFIETDEGQLDQDDRIDTGPENIFWSYNFTPPIGIYHVCFEPYRFDLDISSLNPLSVTLNVLRSRNISLILTKTYKSSIQNSYLCDSTSPTLLTSINYP